MEPIIVTLDLVRPDGTLLYRMLGPLPAGGDVQADMNIREDLEIRGPYTIRVSRPPEPSPAPASPS
jgi:hypothetical protein